MAVVEEGVRGRQVEGEGERILVRELQGEVAGPHADNWDNLLRQRYRFRTVEKKERNKDGTRKREKKEREQ